MTDGHLALAHIVAVAEGRVIGRDGGMPWHIPEDFRFFKTKTSGHALIMGRKTFESIGRPLPGRLSIVVTRGTGEALAALGRPDAPVVPVQSVAAALDVARQHEDRFGGEVFIIGGGEIYRETLPLVDRVYLTKVHRGVDGETLYPELPEAEFEVVEERAGSGEVPVTFVTLARRPRG